MVGSTELRVGLGEERADALRRAHDELIGRAVEAHRGVLLRWTGDGVKAAFPTSSAAVAAAIEMQREHLDEARLLILGTYRDEEAATNPQLRDLLGEIHGSGSASKIELQALSEHDVAEMIATLVPTAPADDVGTFARRVRDESAGNAFFVCELLDHLATTGRLERLVTAGAVIGCRSPIPSVMWSANDWAASPTMPRSSCPLPRWWRWRSTSIWWPRWPAVGHDRRSTGRRTWLRRRAARAGARRCESVRPQRPRQPPGHSAARRLTAHGQGARRSRRSGRSRRRS